MRDVLLCDPHGLCLGQPATWAPTQLSAHPQPQQVLCEGFVPGHNQLGLGEERMIWTIEYSLALHSPGTASHLLFPLPCRPGGSKDCGSQGSCLPTPHLHTLDLKRAP